MFAILRRNCRQYFFFRIVFQCLAVVAMFQCCPCIFADAIWVKGEEQPRYGRIISSDDHRVVFWPQDAPNSTRQEFERSAVEELVINIDSRRLEDLSPEDYTPYRDYAEELAAQKDDPVARDLAIRLYIIAAAGAEDNLRISSLKGLVGLAETDQQRQRWNSLLALYETQSASIQQQSLLISDEITPNDRELALSLVRSIRRGTGTEASELLGKSSYRGAMRHWSHIFSASELERVARLNRLSKSHLYQLLRIELSILNRETKQKILESSQATGWGELSQAESNLTSILPNFQSATRFDPRQSVFREGRWREPN